MGPFSKARPGNNTGWLLMNGGARKELGFGSRADGPTLNTLNLVGAPSISKFSKLRAPVRADTPTLNTLNLVWAPSISKFSKLRAPANADTPTLKTLKLVGEQPV